MRRKMICARILVMMALVVPGVGVLADPALAAEQKTFVGYGALPSDAHASAVSQMHAYSASCVETGTTYSEAGSEHYWQATLTASC
jgi:hypothetical protein